jgi:hypothetical protein
MASAYRCRFLVGGERTRSVYEQVFRADASDEENNRFLAAQLLLAGAREPSAMKSLVFERVGLGPDSRASTVKPPAVPDRPLPPAEPFVHPRERREGILPPAQQRSEVFEPPVEPPAPAPAQDRSPCLAGSLLEQLRPEAGSGPSFETPAGFEPVPILADASPGVVPVTVEAVAAAEPPAGNELPDTDTLLQRLATEVQEARKRQRPAAPPIPIPE